MILRHNMPSEAHYLPCGGMHLHIKYSNGGCSGFEPDSFYIYSAYNFSNRIFIFNFLNYTIKNN